MSAVWTEAREQLFRGPVAPRLAPRAQPSRPGTPVDTSGQVVCPRDGCGRRYLNETFLAAHLRDHDSPPPRLGNVAARRVYDYLRGRVTSGSLEPGSQVNQASVACSMSVGASAVKDAVTALASDGLLEWKGQGNARRAYVPDQPPDGDGDTA